jgi:beta-D-galactosyl-(1->4)-L-rhamnose phosphorylase
MEAEKTGSFTIPGELGCEELTLTLAKKWGADVIRDSDGTVLSDEILNAGYGIYSTICIIRDHNDWAKKNMDKLQQSFLMTQPVIALAAQLEIELMKDYFAEQFLVNESVDSLKYWQVFDRTNNAEVPRGGWEYCEKTQSVVIHKATPWHKYTVNFLAYRIWEEISMYNHTTNNWNKEHLMQIDPRHPETQTYMLNWMENWCKMHPDTTVVRFTSMFYNFVWIWGSSENNRNLFTDWGSYDFTVSPLALDTFAQKYGYTLTSEDFINKGKLHATHLPADQHKLDWIEFINDFVIGFGKKLVEITHKYNKLAYVFYDDSWIGVEPYSPRFAEFQFDGIIKCVFSGFEVRLCSGVQGVKTHELRLHPYLFPVGLGGTPTFMEGGNPTLDAKKYWNSIRRALLRTPIDRIGLGGYLHLTEPYPDFCDYIEKIANEFRTIKILHQAGKPYSLKPKVGILTSWGKFRTWICSGHYHEHPDVDLISIIESLAGSALEIEFLSFEDIKVEIPKDISVIINAGTADSAWSGGFHWNDDAVVDALTEWVYKGGAFIGINEPSATPGYDTSFRMAHVLGIDKDKGERICHGRWAFDAKDEALILTSGSHVGGQGNLYLTDGDAKVLADDNEIPTVTIHDFGKGKGVYFASYRHSLENARMLLNAILYAAGEKLSQPYVTDNLYTECAYFASSNRLVVINNSDIEQETTIPTDDSKVTVRIAPYDTKIIEL